MFIALKVGHQTALAIIPMDTVIIEDLSMALIGPIRRLHLMVKGGTQHFDMTLLGHKINALEANTENAKRVVRTISRVMEYAGFIGHDHIGFFAVDNLMGYIETHESLMHKAMDQINPSGQGVDRVYKEEHERIQRVKAAIVEGINSPRIYW